MKYLFIFIFLGFKPVVTRQNIVIIIIDDIGYEVPGSTPFTQIPPDPAVTIETTEL